MNIQIQKAKKIIDVPYVIIATFHSELDINRVIIKRTVIYSKHCITSLNYLAIDPLQYKDNKILLRLKDYALKVTRKKNNKMFSTEKKFPGDCLIKWFSEKFKSRNLELSNNVKRKYEIENQID